MGLFCGVGRLFCAQVSTTVLVLQCIAACCSTLQCVAGAADGEASSAVCCSELQRVSALFIVLQWLSTTVHTFIACRICSSPVFLHALYEASSEVEVAVEGEVCAYKSWAAIRIKRACTIADGSGVAFCRLCPVRTNISSSSRASLSALHICKAAHIAAVWGAARSKGA